MTQSEKLLINFKASKTLQDLVKNCVIQANNEGVSLTALIELVRDEHYENFGKNTRPLTVSKERYRKATDEELLFKSNVYDFLVSEVSIDECPPLYSSTTNITHEMYCLQLTFFSEIICAAKMLITDGISITQNRIRDVVWSNFDECTGYSMLLSRINKRIKDLCKLWTNKKNWDNNITSFLLLSSRADKILSGYLVFLAENGIQ